MLGETFSRSWELTKQTFGVIKSDKEILIFPVLSTIFSVAFFILMVVPLLLTNILQEFGLDKMGEMATYLIIFLIYLGLSFIATFFNVAVVYCAKKRFEGGDPTFGEGMSEAFKRIHLIFMWSMVSATVGLILRIVEDAASRSKNEIVRIVTSIIVSILGAAWSIVSIFVVPAIVFKGVGPFKALKDSVHTIKKTWGESLVAYYGLGMVKMVFIIGGIIIMGVPAFLLISVLWPVSIALFGALALYLVVVSLLFSTADSIFNTALYMYAESGKTPKVYSHETMHHAFVKQH